MPKQKKHLIAKSSQKVRTKRIPPSSSKHKTKRKNAHKRFRLSLPRIFFLCGVLLVTISLLYHLQQLVNLSFYHQQIPHTIHQTARPVEIRIDKVNIDLPVVETVIANNTWQIADTGISHLGISSRPGENGTSIFYGHNTDDRFGPIRWLSVGDKIQITNADNHAYIYTINKIVIVDPNNTKILTSQKGETLILYTCTGFADLQRYVILAKLAK